MISLIRPITLAAGTGSLVTGRRTPWISSTTGLSFSRTRAAPCFSNMRLMKRSRVAMPRNLWHLTGGARSDIKCAYRQNLKERAMIQLLTIVLPISLFWILAAVYLGGWAVELHGGKGLTQVLGLLLSFILWIVAWRLLHGLFMGSGEGLGGSVMVTLLGELASDVVCWPVGKHVV